jgi:outer membrane protein OmpA-like peptidoglycan-associated protein
VAERKNDTTWTTPFNLGFPINTHEEEGSFIVAASGDSAFFTSDRYHYGRGLDIYSIQLREQLRPVRTIGLHGFITDASTSQPVICHVELNGLHSQKKYDNVITDAHGQFFVTLSKGEDYLCTINSKNYVFYAQKFTVDDTAQDHYLKITLQPIQKNARFALKHILFERNSFSLSAGEQPELEKLYTLMRESPKMEIMIIGHTDNTGKPAYNLNLSKKRAESVMQYLQSKGIEPRRMKAKGMGDREPVDNNSSDEGKNNNRRTEIHVTEF